MTAPVNMCVVCAHLPADQRPGTTDGTIVRNDKLLCQTHADEHDAAVTRGGVAH